MTVSGIGSTSQALANTAIDPNSWQTRMQQTLGPVAQLFGMSTSQLEQALQSGESLNDIASSAGVSQTDLTNAIKAGIQQAQPAGAAPLSDTQLTNLANRIAGHHHHHHGGGAPSATASPSSTSSTNPLAAVEQDLDQLLTDLSTALAGNGSTPASTCRWRDHTHQPAHAVDLGRSTALARVRRRGPCRLGPGARSTPRSTSAARPLS